MTEERNALRQLSSIVGQTFNHTVGGQDGMFAVQLPRIAIRTSKGRLPLPRCESEDTDGAVLAMFKYLTELPPDMAIEVLPLDGTEYAFPFLVKWDANNGYFANLTGQDMLRMTDPIRVNIVYAHRAEPFALRCGNATVYWTPTPLLNMDITAYFDAFSFTGRQEGMNVLVMNEPPVVLPLQYRADVWRHFDKVLTLCDALVESHPKFEKFLHPYYGFGCPPAPTPDWKKLPEVYPNGVELPNGGYTERHLRKNAICMILGNKQSPVEGELYSARREIAEWFDELSEIVFDAYGSPPFEDMPSYLGVIPHEVKKQALAHYRYAVCFENMYHPVWTRGYLTERLLECLETRTVPIYWGCSNIEEYVPTDLFLDMRTMGGENATRNQRYSALNARLMSMTEEEYQGYVARIDAWVGKGKMSAYSYAYLYETLITTYRKWEKDWKDWKFHVYEWEPADVDGVEFAPEVAPLWDWDALRNGA